MHNQPAIESRLQQINSLTEHVNTYAMHAVQRGIAVIDCHLKSQVTVTHASVERTDDALRYRLELRHHSGGPVISVPIDSPAEAAERLGLFMKGRSGTVQRQSDIRVITETFDSIKRSLKTMGPPIGSKTRIVEAIPDENLEPLARDTQKWALILTKAAELESQIPDHWEHAASFCNDAMELDPSFPPQQFIHHCVESNGQFADDVKTCGKTMLVLSLLNYQKLKSGVSLMNTMLQCVPDRQPTAPPSIAQKMAM